MEKAIKIDEAEAWQNYKYKSSGSCMAIIGFIVIGDRTSHGGTVLSGDSTFTIDGQPVARIGDKVVCPRCKTITTIVTSRFPTVSAFGQNLAYDQDSTSCGALLISRHNNHAGWDPSPTESSTAKSDASYTNSANPNDEVSKKAPRFQEHFILHNEEGLLMAKVPYRAITGEGKVFEGETDDSGRTAVIWSDSPDAVQLIVDPKVDETADPYHYDEQSYEGL